MIIMVSIIEGTDIEGGKRIEMSFDFNMDQKVRITFSDKAAAVIMDDMFVFSISKKAEFVNLIFFNYREDSEMSLEHYLIRRKEELLERLKGIRAEEKVKAEIIGAMLEADRKRIRDKINRYSKNGRTGGSEVIRLNKKNTEYLEGEECQEDKVYRESAGRYVKCVLEEYAELPFIKRAKIIKKEVYREVNNAIELKKILRVRTEASGQPEIFLVYPYKIVSDLMDTREYLVGYRRKKGEHSTEKRAASFSLVRMDDVKVMEEKAFLSEKDIRELEKSIRERSAAFLLQEPAEIRVRLTEKGKKLYNRKLYSRPDRISERSTDYEYVFICTENQAYNYFIYFGGEAEVISPASLRKRMFEVYKRGYMKYGENN